MKTARWTISVVLVAVFGVACGGGGQTDGGGGTATGEVNMVDNAFEPSDITVAAGDTLTITNIGNALHSFTTEGGEIDVEVPAAGVEEVEVTLEAGTYPVTCTFHPEMTGSLTVE